MSWLYEIIITQQHHLIVPRSLYACISSYFNQVLTMWLITRVIKLWEPIDPLLPI